MKWKRKKYGTIQKETKCNAETETTQNTKLKWSFFFQSWKEMQLDAIFDQNMNRYIQAQIYFHIQIKPFSAPSEKHDFSISNRMAGHSYFGSIIWTVMPSPIVHWNLNWASMSHMVFASFYQGLFSIYTKQKTRETRSNSPEIQLFKPKNQWKKPNHRQTMKMEHRIYQ